MDFQAFSRRLRRADGARKQKRQRFRHYNYLYAPLGISRLRLRSSGAILGALAFAPIILPHDIASRALLAPLYFLRLGLPFLGGLALAPSNPSLHILLSVVASFFACKGVLWNVSDLKTVFGSETGGTTPPDVRVAALRAVLWSAGYVIACTWVVGSFGTKAASTVPPSTSDTREPPSDLLSGPARLAQSTYASAAPRGAAAGDLREAYRKRVARRTFFAKVEGLEPTDIDMEAFSMLRARLQEKVFASQSQSGGPGGRTAVILELAHGCVLFMASALRATSAGAARAELASMLRSAVLGGIIEEAYPSLGSRAGRKIRVVAAGDSLDNSPAAGPGFEADAWELHCEPSALAAGAPARLALAVSAEGPAAAALDPSRLRAVLWATRDGGLSWPVDVPDQAWSRDRKGRLRCELRMPVLAAGGACIRVGVLGEDGHVARFVGPEAPLPVLPSAAAAEAASLPDLCPTIADLLGEVSRAQAYGILDPAAHYGPSGPGAEWSLLARDLRSDAAAAAAAAGSSSDHLTGFLDRCILRPMGQAVRHRAPVSDAASSGALSDRDAGRDAGESREPRALSNKVLDKDDASGSDAAGGGEPLSLPLIPTLHWWSLAVDSRFPDSQALEATCLTAVRADFGAFLRKYIPFHMFMGTVLIIRHTGLTALTLLGIACQILYWVKHMAAAHSGTPLGATALSRAYLWLDCFVFYTASLQPLTPSVAQQIEKFLRMGPYGYATFIIVCTVSFCFRHVRCAAPIKHSFPMFLAASLYDVIFEASRVLRGRSFSAEGFVLFVVSHVTGLAAATAMLRHREAAVREATLRSCLRKRSGSGSVGL